MLLLGMRLNSPSTSSFQNKNFGAHDDRAKSPINGFACVAASAVRD